MGREREEGGERGREREREERGGEKERGRERGRERDKHELGSSVSNKRLKRSLKTCVLWRIKTLKNPANSEP